MGVVWGRGMPVVSWEGGATPRPREAERVRAWAPRKKLVECE